MAHELLNNQLTMSNLQSTNKPGEAAEQQSSRANSFYWIETKRDINDAIVQSRCGSVRAHLVRKGAQRLRTIGDGAGGRRVGARLVVTPEMGTTGYCWYDRAAVMPFVEAGRRPELYMNLMTNSFTWNPLDFFKLYGPG
jgi:hypothetical protein